MRNRDTSRTSNGQGPAMADAVTTPDGVPRRMEPVAGAVLSGMIERGGGTIITVSSLAAVTPNLLGGAAYGAA